MGNAQQGAGPAAPPAAPFVAASPAAGSAPPARDGLFEALEEALDLSDDKKQLRLVRKLVAQAMERSVAAMCPRTVPAFWQAPASDAQMNELWRNVAILLRCLEPGRSVALVFSALSVICILAVETASAAATAHESTRPADATDFMEERVRGGYCGYYETRQEQAPEPVVATPVSRTEEFEVADRAARRVFRRTFGRSRGIPSLVRVCLAGMRDTAPVTEAHSIAAPCLRRLEKSRARHGDAFLVGDRIVCQLECWTKGFNGTVSGVGVDGKGNAVYAVKFDAGVLQMALDALVALTHEPRNVARAERAGAIKPVAQATTSLKQSTQLASLLVLQNLATPRNRTAMVSVGVHAQMLKIIVHHKRSAGHARGPGVMGTHVQASAAKVLHLICMEEARRAEVAQTMVATAILRGECGLGPDVLAIPDDVEDMPLLWILLWILHRLIFGLHKSIPRDRRRDHRDALGCSSIGSNVHEQLRKQSVSMPADVASAGAAVDGAAAANARSVSSSLHRAGDNSQTSNPGLDNEASPGDDGVVEAIPQEHAQAATAATPAAAAAAYLSNNDNASGKEDFFDVSYVSITSDPNPASMEAQHGLLYQVTAAIACLADCQENHAAFCTPLTMCQSEQMMDRRVPGRQQVGPTAGVAEAAAAAAASHVQGFEHMAPGGFGRKSVAMKRRRAAQKRVDEERLAAARASANGEPPPPAAQKPGHRVAALGVGLDKTSAAPTGIHILLHVAGLAAWLPGHRHESVAVKAMTAMLALCHDERACELLLQQHPSALIALANGHRGAYPPTEKAYPGLNLPRSRGVTLPRQVFDLPLDPFDGGAALSHAAVHAADLHCNDPVGKQARPAGSASGPSLPTSTAMAAGKHGAATRVMRSAHGRKCAWAVADLEGASDEDEDEDEDNDASEKAVAAGEGNGDGHAHRRKHDKMMLDKYGWHRCRSGSLYRECMPPLAAVCCRLAERIGMLENEVVTPTQKSEEKTVDTLPARLLILATEHMVANHPRALRHFAPSESAYMSGSVTADTRESRKAAGAAARDNFRECETRVQEELRNIPGRSLWMSTALVRIAQFVLAPLLADMLRAANAARLALLSKLDERIETVAKARAADVRVAVTKVRSRLRAKVKRAKNILRAFGKPSSRGTPKANGANDAAVEAAVHASQRQAAALAVSSIEQDPELSELIASIRGVNSVARLAASSLAFLTLRMRLGVGVSMRSLSRRGLDHHTAILTGLGAGVTPPQSMTRGRLARARLAAEAAVGSNAPATMSTPKRRSRLASLGEEQFDKRMEQMAAKARELYSTSELTATNGTLLRVLANSAASMGAAGSFEASLALCHLVHSAGPDSISSLRALVSLHLDPCAFMASDVTTRLRTTLLKIGHAAVRSTHENMAPKAVRNRHKKSSDVDAMRALRKIMFEFLGKQQQLAGHSSSASAPHAASRGEGGGGGAAAGGVSGQGQGQYRHEFLALLAHSQLCCWHTEEQTNAVAALAARQGMTPVATARLMDSLGWVMTSATVDGNNHLSFNEGLPLPLPASMGLGHFLLLLATVLPLALDHNVTPPTTASAVADRVALATDAALGLDMKRAEATDASAIEAHLTNLGNKAQKGSREKADFKASAELHADTADEALKVISVTKAAASHIDVRLVAREDGRGLSLRRDAWLREERLRHVAIGSLLALSKVEEGFAKVLYDSTTEMIHSIGFAGDAAPVASAPSLDSNLESSGSSDTSESPGSGSGEPKGGGDESKGDTAKLSAAASSPSTTSFGPKPTKPDKLSQEEADSLVLAKLVAGQHGQLTRIDEDPCFPIGDIGQLSPEAPTASAADTWSLGPVAAGLISAVMSKSSHAGIAQSTRMVKLVTTGATFVDKATRHMMRLLVWELALMPRSPMTRQWHRDAAHDSGGIFRSINRRAAAQRGSSRLTRAQQQQREKMTRELYHAARSGDVRTIREMMADDECDINVEEPGGDQGVASTASDASAGSDGAAMDGSTSVLHAAIDAGKSGEEVVEALLSSRARGALRLNVNKRGKSGATAAMIAASRGDAAALRLLAKRGADLTCFDWQGDRPKFAAARGGYTEALGVIIDVIEGRNPGAEHEALVTGQKASSSSSNGKTGSARVGAPPVSSTTRLYEHTGVVVGPGLEQNHAGCLDTLLSASVLTATCGALAALATTPLAGASPLAIPFLTPDMDPAIIGDVITALSNREAAAVARAAEQAPASLEPLPPQPLSLFSRPEHAVKTLRAAKDDLSAALRSGAGAERSAGVNAWRRQWHPLLMLLKSRDAPVSVRREALRTVVNLTKTLSVEHGITQEGELAAQCRTTLRLWVQLTTKALWHGQHRQNAVDSFTSGGGAPTPVVPHKLAVIAADHAASVLPVICHVVNPADDAARDNAHESAAMPNSTAPPWPSTDGSKSPPLPIALKPSLADVKDAGSQPQHGNDDGGGMESFPAAMDPPAVPISVLKPKAREPGQLFPLPATTADASTRLKELRQPPEHRPGHSTREAARRRRTRRLRHTRSLLDGKSDSDVELLDSSSSGGESNDQDDDDDSWPSSSEDDSEYDEEDDDALLGILSGAHVTHESEGEKGTKSHKTGIALEPRGAVLLLPRSVCRIDSASNSDVIFASTGVGQDEHDRALQVAKDVVDESEESGLRQFVAARAKLFSGAPGHGHGQSEEVAPRRGWKGLSLPPMALPPIMTPATSNWRSRTGGRGVSGLDGFSRDMAEAASDAREWARGWTVAVRFQWRWHDHESVTELQQWKEEAAARVWSKSGPKVVGFRGPNGGSRSVSAVDEPKSKSSSSSLSSASDPEADAAATGQPWTCRAVFPATLSTPRPPTRRFLTLVAGIQGVPERPDINDSTRGSNKQAAAATDTDTDTFESTASVRDRHTRAQRHIALTQRTSLEHLPCSDGTGGVSWQSAEVVTWHLCVTTPEDGVLFSEDDETRKEQVWVDDAGKSNSGLNDTDSQRGMLDSLGSALGGALSGAANLMTHLPGFGFTSLDTDGDGLVTAAEIAKARGVSLDKAKQILEQLDTDKDGVLSANEFTLPEGVAVGKPVLRFEPTPPPVRMASRGSEDAAAASEEAAADGERGLWIQTLPLRRAFVALMRARASSNGNDVGGAATVLDEEAMALLNEHKVVLKAADGRGRSLALIWDPTVSSQGRNSSPGKSDGSKDEGEDPILSISAKEAAKMWRERHRGTWVELAGASDGDKQEPGASGTVSVPIDDSVLLRLVGPKRGVQIVAAELRRRDLRDLERGWHWLVAYGQPGPSALRASVVESVGASAGVGGAEGTGPTGYGRVSFILDNHLLGHTRLFASDHVAPLYAIGNVVSGHEHFPARLAEVRAFYGREPYSTATGDDKELHSKNTTDAMENSKHLQTKARLAQEGLVNGTILEDQRGEVARHRIDVNRHRRCLLEAGVMPLVLDILREEGPELAELAARCIGNLALTSPAARDAALSAGARKLLLKLASSDDPELASAAIQGAIALYSLTWHWHGE